MNKQEAIKRLHNIAFKDVQTKPYDLKLADVIAIINQIDEPKKPIVTKDEFYQWLGNPDNNPILTLVNMHQFGYEVEKEKKYTVKIPNPNSKGTNKFFLQKDHQTGKVFLCKGNFNPRKNKTLWLTEAEIKKDFEWAWQFAEPVEDLE